MRSVLEKFNQEVTKWDRINDLSKRANEMIEQIVPHMYADGDVRMIASETYQVLRGMMDERNKLLGLTEQERQLSKELVYIGPFGTLTIKESK